MKKRLLILVFAIGMMGFTQVKAAIDNFCFTDAFGYTANVTATKTAPGYWMLSGTADVLTGYDWSISGYYDKGSDVWSLTYTNTAPDGCTFYVDYFTYTSYAHGAGVIYFNWTSYCFGGPLSSGSGSTTWTNAACAGRLGDDRTVVGPVSTDESIYSNPVADLKSLPGGITLNEFFTEASLSVIKTDENNFGISYEVAGNTNVEVMIYNHIGQYVATVVNENQADGFYRTSWNATEALPGMYVAVLKTDAETITKKFVK